MTLPIFAERDGRYGLWQYRCPLAARSFDLLDTLHVERSVPFRDPLLHTLRIERSVSFQALLDSFHVERPVSFQALLCSSARAESNTSSARVLRYFARRLAFFFS